MIIIVTLKESPGNVKTYQCKRFASEPSPFGLPLLLTADGVLRVFKKEGKVISSKFWEIFPSKLDKFLHPHLHELNLDPAYFLEASEENWDLVQDIVTSVFVDDESLACQRLKWARSFINIDAILKPLWRCLFKDPVIRKHSKAIVQKWALILSETEELFQYDPNHGHLMPIVPPRKPKHMEKSKDHQKCSQLTEVEKEEEKEYDLFSKLLRLTRCLVFTHSCTRQRAFVPLSQIPKASSPICIIFTSNEDLLIMNHTSGVGSMTTFWNFLPTFRE